MLSCLVLTSLSLRSSPETSVSRCALTSAAASPPMPRNSTGWHPGRHAHRRCACRPGCQPVLLRGIGGLAAALVKAQRETDVSGEDRSESEVSTKQLSIPYVPRRKIGTLDALTLAERA